MTSLWHKPILRLACIVVVGVVLQLVVGTIDASPLRYPWSAIVAINYLYLLVLAYAMEDKWRWVRSLRSRHSSVVALGAMVVMTIIFGLTRQDGSLEGVAGALGFTQMTGSWLFNLVLLNFITTLGLALIDDWWHIRTRHLAPLLAHTALFVALVASMAGSGDKVRVRLTCQLDKPIYQAADEQQRLYELPFAIRLLSFEMEEYAPSLYLYNISRESLSEESLSLADSVGSVDDWSLRVVDYLPMAGRMPDEAEYRAMQHVGATHAVRVVAEHRLTEEKKEGWVSCGSHIFSSATLPLSADEALVMPRPKAKSYRSRIAVERGEGDTEYYDIRVNHPARIGAWRIYQVGYDTEQGRWSSTSVLECVRDGWYSIVHIALWLTLAAAVVMFLTAGGRFWQRKEQEEEVAK